MMGFAFIAFDTLCRIQINDECGERFPTIKREVEASARQVEKTLSMFDDTSELKCLCDRYVPDRWYEVSSLLHDFLLENQRMFKWSQGAFDPTVGSIVKAWNFLADCPVVPTDDTIQMLLQHVGFQFVEIDGEVPRVRFHAPGMVIDPGASGKGFALEQAVQILRQANIGSASLNYGGNLFVLGTRDEHASPWRAGIVHPDDPSKIYTTVDLVDQGISTSSWYEHGFSQDGEIYHHILDPRTGRPQKRRVSSVSVISDNAFYTDLVSTPLFMLDEDAHEPLLEQIRREKGIKLETIVIPL